MMLHLDNEYVHASEHVLQSRQREIIWRSSLGESVSYDNINENVYGIFLVRLGGGVGRLGDATSTLSNPHFFFWKENIKLCLECASLASHMN